MGKFPITLDDICDNSNYQGCPLSNVRIAKVQLVEDAVARLDSGSSPSSVVIGPTVDVARSLAPYVVIYDRTGTILASSGSLDGKAPMPPASVLTGAMETGLDRVTSQPRPDVRSAIVVMPWSGGTVFAGRSPRRVDEVEANIERLALAAAAVLVVAAGVMSVVAAWLWPRRHRKPAEGLGGEARVDTIDPQASTSSAHRPA